MRLASSSRKFSGALVAFAMITSSTGAMAASTHAAPSYSISPLVALSALASDASRVALCGAAAAAAAGAVSDQGATPGCVLPVVDQAAPIPVSEALPPPPVAPPPVAPLASEGFGISPLLLGLVAVAAAAGLYFLLYKKKSSSPN